MIGKNDSRLRILHLVTWLTTGGIEHWLVEFIRSTLSTEIEMSVCCRKRNTGKLASQVLDMGANVNSCPMLPNVYSYERRLQQLIRESRADIVHNHLGATSMLAVRAAKNCGVPVITTFHSPQFAPQTTVTRLPIVRNIRKFYTTYSINYAIENSDMVTGVSRGVLEALVPDYQTNSRFRVTYLGLPPRARNSYPDNDIRRSQGWHPSAPIIVKLGRLAPEKSTLQCIEIFAQVKRSLVDAKMVFLGDGPLRDDVLQLATKLGVADSIALLGYRPDAPSLLKQANILLQPSRYEGFGLAAVEAAAVGVPTVASDVPGLNEAVINNVTGFLHQQGDLGGMAASIVTLLNNRELYERLSLQATAFAKRDFDTGECQSRFIDLYRSLAGKRTFVTTSTGVRH